MCVSVCVCVLACVLEHVQERTSGSLGGDGGGGGGRDCGGVAVMLVVVSLLFPCSPVPIFFWRFWKYPLELFVHV